MLCAAVPGIIILIAGLILPESPSSLAETNNIDEARRVSGHASLLIILLLDLSHVLYIWVLIWTGQMLQPLLRTYSQ